MADSDPIAEVVDGRVARRQRNIDVVIDVILEMFAEDAMFPTIEQAATRSGLSLRSLYRYFADPAELMEATINRSFQRGVELSHLHAIGEGPLDRRIEDFVRMRLGLHDAVGPVMRATMANAARMPRIRDELAKNLDVMRGQFEQQFAPELTKLKKADRQAVLAAGDFLTQPHSFDYLRRHRKLSVDETRHALTTGLHSLLD